MQISVHILKIRSHFEIAGPRRAVGFPANQLKKSGALKRPTDRARALLPTPDCSLHSGLVLLPCGLFSGPLASTVKDSTGNNAVEDVLWNLLPRTLTCGRWSTLALSCLTGKIFTRRRRTRQVSDKTSFFHRFPLQQALRPGFVNLSPCLAVDHAPGLFANHDGFQ